MALLVNVVAASPKLHIANAHRRNVATVVWRCFDWMIYGLQDTAALHGMLRAGVEGMIGV